MFHKDTLIVLTRYPHSGSTKTRLIPSLGKDGAAEIHRKMALKTVLTCQRYSSLTHAKVEIHYEGGDESLMKQWLGNSLSYTKQAEGDLGDRMAQAFRVAFQKGSWRVVIIGTDCPELSADHLNAAFDSLRANPLVLGPAHDGGFYLIGMRHDTHAIVNPKLFASIEWGTSTVLESTCSNARTLNISTTLLSQLHDVDRPEDIAVWERSQKKISIIIPFLNEAENIDATLSKAMTGANVEIIAVDGGSTDDSAEIVRDRGVTVIDSPKGRAVQMNQGFLHATGAIVMFLHADTLLPVDYDVLARAALEDLRTICGAFRFKINSQRRGVPFIEMAAHLRAKYAHMPYGDQALFMRAETFRESGGYPEMLLMEDFEFVRRLKCKGKITILKAPAITSGRRWDDIGIWRTTVINKIVIYSYLLGVSPETLHKIYHRASK